MKTGLARAGMVVNETTRRKIIWRQTRFQARGWSCFSGMEHRPLYSPKPRTCANTRVLIPANRQNAHQGLAHSTGFFALVDISHRSCGFAAIVTAAIVTSLVFKKHRKTKTAVPTRNTSWKLQTRGCISQKNQRPTTAENVTSKIARVFRC